MFVLLTAPAAYQGLQVQPRLLNPEEVAIQQAAQWLRTQPAGFPKVVATHVWFYYFYQLEWTPQQSWTSPPPPDVMAHGTVVVWDKHYSEWYGIHRDSLREDARWIELAQFGSGQVIIFQRR
jgi:hypothetical protein